MQGRIEVKSRRCKGCGLCIQACPNGCITSSRTSNPIGYFPAQPDNQGCTGCALCARVCPDAVIEVYRESIEILATEAARSGNTGLIKEKV